MRTDGELCSPSSDQPFAAAWIGIEQQTGSQITQIGVEKDFDSVGSSRWCRFWATGIGVAHDYDCGGTANYAYVYFQINTYFNGSSIDYVIYGCGTGGGYGSCTVENDTQYAYGDPQGVVAAETDYGCAVYIMGSTSEPTYYGNGAYPVQGLVQDWETRDWGTINNQDCTNDYVGGTGTGTFATWDTRNGS